MPVIQRFKTLATKAWRNPRAAVRVVFRLSQAAVRAVFRPARALIAPVAPTNVAAITNAWIAIGPNDRASALRVAVVNLSLSMPVVNGLKAALDSLLKSDPPLVAELHRIVADYDVADAEYAKLLWKNPDIVEREKKWLAALVSEALQSNTTGWAALYLALAHKHLLVRRIDHVVNPRSHVQMPSAFVYAMQ